MPGAWLGQTGLRQLPPPELPLLTATLRKCARLGLQRKLEEPRATKMVTPSSFLTFRLTSRVAFRCKDDHTSVLTCPPCRASASCEICGIQTAVHDLREGFAKYSEDDWLGADWVHLKCHTRRRSMPDHFAFAGLFLAAARLCFNRWACSLSCSGMSAHTCALLTEPPAFLLFGLVY